MYTVNWNPSQYWEILMLQYLIKPCVYWFCEPPEKQIKDKSSIGPSVSVDRG